MRVPSPCPSTTRSLPPPQFLLPRSQISSASRGGGHSLLRCPDFGRRPSRGCRWGGSSCSGLPSRGPVQGAGAGRRRSWVLSLAPGGPERAPNSAPRRGAGARRALGWPGQRADLSSSRGTRPAQHHRSPGSVRTGTRRPAAHDDIKSPPPVGPHIPAGLGAGGGVGGWGAASGSSRPGQLGDVVPSPIKAAA